MDWNEIKITTRSEAVEAISAALYDMGIAGISIQDPQDIVNYQGMPFDWLQIDENLLKGDLHEAIIKVYFPLGDNIIEKTQVIKERLDSISKFIDVGKGSVEVTMVNEADWENAWKKYYKPVKVGEKIVIKPTWENYNTSEGEIIVELDPGMAFGTGTHETTRMSIKMLEKYLPAESTVFDIGCGSGILGIAASKLGAQKIIGVDLDPVAVKVSMENIEVNSISDMEVRHGNLLDVVDEKADVVVANIIANVIIILADYIGNYIKPGGLFICSGIIKDRLEDVKTALNSKGFEIMDIMYEGEWVAITSSVK